ncbi:hypothetical protein D3C74_264710 [compost metagenome]
MGAQRRLAARAIRADAVSAVQQTLVVDRRQDVPDAFDVAVIQGDIRIIQVDPISNRFGKFAPLLLITEDAVFTFFHEFLNAVFLDLLLAGDAQLLLHAQFNRQSVRIPARFADDAVALHRLIAANEVLDDAPQHVPDMRQAVGGWRSFEEDVVWPTRPIFDTPFKRIFAAPFVQNPQVARTRIFFDVDFLHVSLPFFNSAWKIKKAPSLEGTRRLLALPPLFHALKAAAVWTRPQKDMTP